MHARRSCQRLSRGRGFGVCLRLYCDPDGAAGRIRQQPAGAIWTIYTLLVVWAGDIFAYFVGKSVGRHRMSPEISPKKTWEGAVASILASVIVGTLWIQHAPGISSALLRIGLIDRRDGMFGLEQPSTLAHHSAVGGGQHRGPTGRSGRVPDQTRCRSQRIPAPFSPAMEACSTASTPCCSQCPWCGRTAPGG
jgi:hypothetical protein